MLILAQASGIVTSPPPVIPPPPIARARPAEFRFDIDETPYRMPWPGGFCTMNNAHPTLRKDSVSPQGRIQTYLAYSERCRESGETGDAGILLVKYFSNVTYPHQTLKEFIAADAERISSQELMDHLESDELIDLAKERTSELAEDGEFDDMALDIGAQPLGHDKTCLYTGSRIHIEVPSRNEKANVLSVKCSTYINRRVVLIDVTGDADKTNFDTLKLEAQAIAQSIEPREG
jgi:hypothetical protein